MLRQELSRLRRRIVLAQGLRGVAFVASTLVFLHLVLFTVSLWLGASTLALQIGLTGFATVAAGLFVWFGYRGRRSVLDDRTVAALVEKRYPELGEKLLTAVEAHQGDARFFAQVEMDAERAIADLDLREAYSLHRAVQSAMIAAAILLVALLMLAIWPRYARFSERFFMAWLGPSVGYRLEVSPGDGWHARGRSATIEVRLIDEDGDVPLPADCFVVYHFADGKPQRVRMDCADNVTFLYSWPALRDDVTYRIEAGELVDGPYRLAVVDAVELASAPKLHVTPPPYVNPDYLPTHTLTDGGPFTVVQFSSVRIDLDFTATPSRVTVTIRDAASGKVAGALVASGPAGQPIGFDLPTDHCGVFAATLLIVGEHGITTTHQLPSWTVRPDRPPHFSRSIHVRGVRDQVLYEQGNRVSMDDPLRVQATVEDAEGLGPIILEYRINGGVTAAQPWLDGAGRLRVEIDQTLGLPRTLKEGDIYRFRLGAADNRNLAKGALAEGLPPTTLSPQVAHSPASEAEKERWIEVRIGKSADSLLGKELALQHDELQKMLEQIRQKLRKEHAALAPLRQASHQQADISPAQLQQLAEVNRLNKQAVIDLEQIADKLSALPELAPLGDHLLAIGDIELAAVARSLEQFKRRDRTAIEREKDVQAGEVAVLQALKKLDGIGNLAEQLAQGRLDRLEMERLALAEQELARRAEALLDGADATDPKMEKVLAELRAEQERVAARLKQLGESSELLKDAMAQAEAKRLADDAGKLAREQRALMGVDPEPKDGDPAKVKAAAQAKAEKLLDEMKQLAGDTLKLSQQANSAEMKKLAEQSAHAAEEASKVMEKSLSDKPKSTPSKAKAMEADTLQKIEIMRKSLEALAEKMPATPEGAKQSTKTAKAQQDAQTQVRMAQQKLQGQPGQAPKAMQQAAKSLDKTAQQMGQQMAQSIPKAAGRPSIGAGGGAPGGLALPAPLAKMLESFQGRAWGELPGELKTQLLQDARAKFGDEYAPIIQRYFEQIAERRQP